MTVSLLGRRWPAAATYVVALAAALLLLVATVGAALWQVQRTVDLNQAVRVSTEARGHLRLFFRAMQDAETGQRGYLLTGEEPYLTPYTEARVQAQRELTALEALASRNQLPTAEISRLRALAEEKLTELGRTIELRRRGRISEALVLVRSDRGKAVMDELRSVIGRAEEREQQVLNERMSESDNTALQLRLIVLLAAALLLGVGTLLVIAVRNAMLELRATAEDARAAHARLSEEMDAREQAESKVRQMQKMEAIGQITGGVAHDFNNMLAVIMSALQLAKRRMERGEKGAETFLDAAMDGARRAATLTSRLLAFARRTPLTPSVIDINRVLGDMSDMLRRTLGEQIALETVFAGGLWRVSADRNELEQAILNICVNARDAMPNGGKLTVESGNAWLDEKYAAVNVDVTPGQYVMVAITDTGAGMNTAVQQRAFEPFFTTKDVGKGTGLGLSHVHGFLKQSGGHVAIYSELGHGTTLKLYLPRTALAAEETPEAAPEGDEAYAGETSTIVLVVEDDDRVRMLSVTALRELGYTVLHASNGREALDKLSVNPGIALIFTDVVMPEMSGRALADEAKKLYPDVKVLYTTGYTQNAIVHNGVVDADARLLLKPYSLSDLARKVRAALEAK